MDPRLVRTSKFLSRILRHDPGSIGLTLDPGGWARVDDLLEKAGQANRRITRPELERVVAENDKGRFAFSPDGQKIRATHGHSIHVELDLEARVPPEVLYHGTALRFLESIRAKGLLPGNRNFVHLSADIETAFSVGKRHGEPVVLEVEAGRMVGEGIPFYCSASGIWLVERVPVTFLKFPPAS